MDDDLEDYWGEMVSWGDDESHDEIDQWRNKRGGRAKVKLAPARQLSKHDFNTLKALDPARVLLMLANRVEVEAGHYQVRQWLDDNVEEYYLEGNIVYLPNEAAKTKFLLAMA